MDNWVNAFWNFMGGNQKFVLNGDGTVSPIHKRWSFMGFDGAGHQRLKPYNSSAKFAIKFPLTTDQQREYEEKVRNSSNNGVDVQTNRNTEYFNIQKARENCQMDTKRY